MTKTLLVDGDNLLTIGFYGVKGYFNGVEHVGGIWHFLNTLRRFIDEDNFNKTVVFWDGETSSSQRRMVYPNYKLNRKRSEDENLELSYNKQKQRVKQYLEEMFVRQVEFENSEADDLIAYYCKIAKDESKTIFSADRDLTQLISEDVTIYSPNTKKYYKKGDTIKMNSIEIPHYNVKTFKIISGDKSDNINGIYYLGEKTFVKLFPEILEKEISFSDILKRGEDLLKEQKDNTTLKNLLTGRTKEGIFGDEFFEVNKKIVDLSEPLISEEGKELVKLYYIRHIRTHSVIDS